MAFDFPATPSVGQVYTSAGCSFVWNGYGWAGGLSGDTGEFVKKAGDTMTGALTLASATPQLKLDAPAGARIDLDHNSGAGGDNSTIFGMTNGVRRWAMELGNTVAESGSNAGADFGLTRYSDAGVAIDSPLSIERATGKVTLGLNQIANVPQAFAHRSGAGSVALGTAAWTKVNLGTIATTGAAGYFSLGGNRLTVLKPGVYWVDATVLIQTPTAICNILGGFGYNSDTVPSRYWRGQNPAANNWQYSGHACGIFNCAANDFFSLLAYCGVAGGSCLDTAQETCITAFLLAAT